jgi:hypothetical protein
MYFWARGYCVSTVGLDEKLIRGDIRNQEVEEKRQEQLRLSGVLYWSLPGAFIIPPALRVVTDSGHKTLLHELYKGSLAIGANSQA